MRGSGRANPKLGLASNDARDIERGREVEDLFGGQNASCLGDVDVENVSGLCARNIVRVVQLLQAFVRHDRHGAALPQ